MKEDAIKEEENIQEEKLKEENLPEDNVPDVTEENVQDVSEENVQDENVQDENVQDECDNQECSNTQTNNAIQLPNNDYDVLVRIVEAEATGEDMKGKILVANVILNRVKHESFPNTVTDVVFETCGGSPQFSPTADGRFDSVRISEGSKEAVNRALAGEDFSNGALYFSARSHADPNNMSWFDTHLKWLFKYGGHEFYALKD
ncbi:hypothetical protein DWV06_11445 [Anaerosacchariphilus polymeriproducens]|uniref:Cell wall hydrolase SleB domain-containing protein n=2 Tax=Anaerosacchariphilus polymeriproducens TaxID=1812858 RepID=A0A371AUJ4_9FIRM|nr:hypothetical protein DWV06_11445 [Anaerosacchariphilus polymeriproducens]